MPGLTIFTGNRLETLAKQLAQIVRAPITSPLSPEILLIQSKGMERWLSMELAKHNGVCANCSFLFPNAFLREIYKKIIPDLPETSRFELDIMTFSVMKVLPSHINQPGFESLKNYLTDDQHQLKLYQVSKKIVDTFDQYLVFRPEMIFSWEAGLADHWQAKLWRGIVSDGDNLHRARLRKTLIQKIRNKEVEIDNFFERISIFGISYLPDFHLQVFSELSRIISVNLFLMNPCREYWADIVSDRGIKQIKGRYADKQFSEDSLHFERGNRLLASMGLMGKNFFSRINEFDCKTIEKFEARGDGSLLSTLHGDILNLIDKPGSKPAHEAAYDRSIQFHSCHSPMREIEVLHDNLLAMFEEKSKLLPKNIIVMTPDIEFYAPFIHSIFDTQNDPTLRIPYSIADQNIRKNSRIIDGFLAILNLCGGRFGNAQVLLLLEFPAIREKFGLIDADLKKIEFWIRDTHIRWGIDVDNRTAFGLPGVFENTWKAGIERILLGYAMPGHDQRSFSGILPYDHIEGNDGEIFGNFVAFIDRITAHVTKLNRSYNLASWHNIFVKILEEIFQLDEESTDEIQLLRRIVDDMVNNGELARYDKKIDFQMIRSHIKGCLERETLASGFITGGVTFCAMLPMRNIPAAIVCLIGMNNDAFPRDSRPISFDLMSQHPKPGDRSRRNDDKYLFLETLLSAREKLYISYVGQNIQDNTPIPPSVMVSELIDYLTEGFSLSKDQLVTRHKLQAFSPSYFKDDGRLFSFSEENFQAAGKIYQHQNPVPFISTMLSVPSDDMKQLDIDTLCAFYAHPTKFLLQKRFGLFLETGTSILNERENFRLNPLENYQIGQSLVKKRLSGLDLKAFLPTQKATGQLPHGKVGEVVYSELSVDADIFVKKIEPFFKGKSGTARQVDLEVGDFVLIGEFSDIYECGRVGYRFANKKAKDLLRSWIYHLVFCLSVKKKTSLTSILICKDSIWEFSPVKESREILMHLLELYWKGLSTLIHFFPESSYEYAKQLLTKKQPEPKAMALSQKKWSGSDFSRGESEDPYYDRCFSHIDPIDDRFCKMAADVFEPLLTNCRETTF